MISSIIVTEDFSCPDSHPILVFSRPWYGNDIGCDCLGIGMGDTNYNLEGNEDRIRPGG